VGGCVNALELVLTFAPAGFAGIVAEVVDVDVEPWRVGLRILTVVDVVVVGLAQPRLVVVTDVFFLITTTGAWPPGVVVCAPALCPADGSAVWLSVATLRADTDADMAARSAIAATPRPRLLAQGEDVGKCLNMNSPCRKTERVWSVEKLQLNFNVLREILFVGEIRNTYAIL
jgi:hypothetical protein